MTSSFPLNYTGTHVLVNQSLSPDAYCCLNTGVLVALTVQCIQSIDKQCPTLCEEGSGLSNSRCVIHVSCNDPFADVYPFINVVVMSF